MHNREEEPTDALIMQSMPSGKSQNRQVVTAYKNRKDYKGMIPLRRVIQTGETKDYESASKYLHGKTLEMRTSPSSWT
jgi:hypothetical protein